MQPSENERRRKDRQMLLYCQRTEKIKDHGDIVIGIPGTVPNGLENTSGIENQRKDHDYTEHRIIKMGKNTEKSPVCPRRLAQVKDYQ